MQQPIEVKKFTGGINFRKITYLKRLETITKEIEDLIKLHKEQNKNIVGFDLDIHKILIPEFLFEEIEVPQLILNIPTFKNTLEDENANKVILANDVYCKNNLGINLEFLNIK